MKTVARLSDLPNVPAVYALCAGEGRTRYVVYVGIGAKLRTRVEQHLISRDSSVTTGRAAAQLQADLVREVRWWEAPAFADRVALEAAELVAQTVLDPALRSRGTERGAARALCDAQEFRDRMGERCRGEPTGCVVLPTLESAMTRIDQLEDRVAELEELLRTSAGRTLAR